MKRKKPTDKQRLDALSQRILEAAGEAESVAYQAEVVTRAEARAWRLHAASLRAAVREAAK